MPAPVEPRGVPRQPAAAHVIDAACHEAHSLLPFWILFVGFVVTEMQRLGIRKFKNNNQITYRPVGRPGDLVETVSPNTARERRPDPSYGQFCRQEPKT